jgi:hypothetical protein
MQTSASPAQVFSAPLSPAWAGRNSLAVRRIMTIIQEIILSIGIAVAAVTVANLVSKMVARMM